MRGTFRSLAIRDYAIWAAGALMSNVGTWMQRTAQDWLVLTELTHNSATAVGVVMALQFAPQFLLLAFTGTAADLYDRRALLILTQSAQAVLALAIGIAAVLGLVRLWHVYIFASLLGVVTAFDAPARQVFVSQLVGERDLPNAVALNSMSFSLARMIGPAVAGILIATMGTGWMFILNALSFVFVIASLTLIRPHRDEHGRSHERAGGLLQGLRYVGRRGDLKTLFVMLFLIGTFGLNFPIYLSTMSVSVFDRGASAYGLLTSIMAIGSVVGALLAASRMEANLRVLVMAAALLGVTFGAASIMPTYLAFGLAFGGVGIATQLFTTGSNAFLQLATTPNMRGRVMAIGLAIALGSMPIGAPVVGRVADVFGPRVSLLLGAASGTAAALVGAVYLMAVGAKGPVEGEGTVADEAP